ncbi:competence/damage-inducible protein A [Tenacibaculum sp. 190524A05c]|uniref:competence/damage-inducible protein A n=1 Tax=Tenacibaculum platacis TaxID=3137852 RepID=UPI0032B1EF0A
MKAEIITIGDEILIGQIIDTNSQWIGKELNKIGVSVYQITSIQDERQHILNALKEAQNRVDVVIITGGLGPTKDDITKKTIAEYFNDTEIVEYPEVIDNIKYLFKKINHPFNEVQKYQAHLPSKATLLMNRLGTAPGMWFYEDETVFVSLPGVPYEMRGLMTYEVLPKIQEQFDLPYILHKTILTYGQGESVIASTIEDFENNLPHNIKLAYLPSFGKVRLRLSGKDDNLENLKSVLNKEVEKLTALVSDIFVGYEDEGAIESQVGKFLKAHDLTICTAESMTGGKIASTLVSVPGSSSYFKGGFVVYTSKLKEDLLDVPSSLIVENTVVSKEVAEVMALNARKKVNTDFAISITGNAGPTTDHNDKDVGLVYIGIADKNGVEVHEYNFGKPREKVINKTVNKALELILRKNMKN